jgi:glutamate-1-semialdehyde 2,1-aminomutase
MQLARSKQLFERAQQSLVGGVNSPVRAFNSVGGNPLFIEKGKGAYIYDVDGNEYIDLVGSYGPLILGHAHPVVNEAVKSAMDKSYTYGATTEAEIEMAELVKEAFPQLDKIRFVNSGTEAVLSAIRLARAATGRNKIIKFAGCYHGHSDALLVAAGSGLATLGIPSSAGVPEEAVKDTLIAQYNNIESVKELLAEFPEQVAAIFIEPVAGNMGVVVPEQSFMEELRALCEKEGTLLVIDEVMTGFRKKFGGAQDFFGIEADITCMGKVIGGGMPVGAYGAKAAIMDQVAPLGQMYQAGTLSGSPIAMACGLATLKELKKQDYDRGEKMALQLKEAIEQAAKENNIAIQVNQFGLMINPFFTTEKVSDFASAQKSDTELFARFFWAMAENGLYIPPSQFEAWFLPITLSDEELSLIIKRVHAAFQAISQ